MDVLGKCIYFYIPFVSPLWHNGNDRCSRSRRISYPIFYGDLVYKLRMVKGTKIFVSPGSKIAKRLLPQTYDPVIIEKTTSIGIVLGSSIVLYNFFLEHCTLRLTRRRAILYMTRFFKTSSVETMCLSLSPLIVRQNSFSHWS